jgi:glutamine synthetase
MSNPDPSDITVQILPTLLKDDIAVKVAGIDVDGMLRGKLMAKKKFLSIAQDGFGFCSVIFGWDMHDQTYFRELGISNKENGYRDLIAVPDLTSFRRIPWENNVPFFLVSFFDPDTNESLSACPRSLLKRAVGKLAEKGYGAMAGGTISYPLITFFLHTDSLPQRNTSSTNSEHHRPTTAPNATPPPPPHSSATTPPTNSPPSQKACSATR